MVNNPAGASPRRPRWASLLAALLLAVLVDCAAVRPAGAQASGTVTVYTSLQKELLGPYEAAFRKEHPEIQLAWIREATGVLHARLLAERANPQADVLFGVPVANIIALNQSGMIEPYAPKDFDKLKPYFHDTATPPAWTGMDMWLNVICFNTVEAERRHIPRPTRWSDLTNPVYRGQVTLPSPAASQTGFLNVTTWIQTMGDASAWTFMDALDQNVAIYTNSSSTPCKLAATGEYVVGGSTDITAPILKTKGAPIDIIVPEDKTAWEMEASALIKGGHNVAAAKVFLDWSVSRAANEQYNRFMGIVAMPGLTSAPPNYPVGGEALMAHNDVAWSVQNRDRIIKEWTDRYQAKAEAKGQ
jgi:iron(III) transport system substrate-binding protein